MSSVAISFFELVIQFFYILLDCTPKDDDYCLQSSPDWDSSYECSTSTEYCLRWGRDMMRCCPISCGTGDFSLENCRSFQGLGSCT